VPQASADYGVPIERVRACAQHWAGEYDWRAYEDQLNRWPQFKTSIDGDEIHFIHARSPHAAALPLVVMLGFPSSLAELLRFTSERPAARSDQHLETGSIASLESIVRTAYASKTKASRRSWLIKSSLSLELGQRDVDLKLQRHAMRGTILTSGTTQLSADGLRYIRKAKGCQFNDGMEATSSMVMSCFRCGAHRLRAELASARILGTVRLVCAGPCSNSP
jgi:hypothetical protein